jgi:hypothetical protein
VEERDLERACDLLSAVGYRSAFPRGDLRRRFQAVSTNFHNDNAFLNVDLHWELSPAYFPFGPRGDEIWRRAITVDLDSRPLRTLAHEDHLLYLAVHSARHGWSSLGHIRDIAYFTVKVSLDWNSVSARAKQTRCTTMLNTGLLLAAALPETTLPQRIVSQAQADLQAVRLAARIRAEHHGTDFDVHSALIESKNAILGIDGLRDRLKYLLVRAFEPTLMDWAFWPLPPRWYQAYYLIRPVRLLLALRRMITRHQALRG